MLLSGLFRTLKEKTYLSVTFINAGNSFSLLSFETLSLSLTCQIPKHWYHTEAAKLLQLLLIEFTGVEVYSGDNFPRLHLINNWGSSAFPHHLQ